MLEYVFNALPIIKPDTGCAGSTLRPRATRCRLLSWMCGFRQACLRSCRSARNVNISATRGRRSWIRVFEHRDGRVYLSNSFALGGHERQGQHRVHAFSPVRQRKPVTRGNLVYHAFKMHEIFFDKIVIQFNSPGCATIRLLLMVACLILAVCFYCLSVLVQTRTGQCDTFQVHETCHVFRREHDCCYTP